MVKPGRERLSRISLSFDESQLKLASCRVIRAQNDPSVLDRLVDIPVYGFKTSHFGDSIARQSIERGDGRPVYLYVAVSHSASVSCKI